MNLFSLPLQWPENPARRAEMERWLLQLVALWATMPEPRQLDGQRPDGRLPDGGRHSPSLFVRQLLGHWPAGRGRSPEIAWVAERYGDDPGPTPLSGRGDG